MSGKAVTAAGAILKLAIAYGDASEELKAAEGEVVAALHDMKCMSMNATRIYKAFSKLEDVEEDEELCMAMWRGFLEWLETQDALAGWLQILRAKLPADDLAYEHKVEHQDRRPTTLQSLGIRLELVKYDGTPGKCAEWWRRTKMRLASMKVPREHYMTVLADSLTGSAATEFWRRFEERERAGTVEVQGIMQDMIGLFDAGQHMVLLGKLRKMEQLKGETCLHFRERFLDVVRGLEQYHYVFTPLQLAMMFGVRMLAFERIASCQPQTISDILNAVAQLNLDEKASSPVLFVGKDTRRCFKCQQVGHLARTCTNPEAAVHIVQVS